MIDLDDNIPFEEEVRERLVVEEESIREKKGRSARLEEQHRDREGRWRKTNGLKISSVRIDLQNILCDKHKSLDRVECRGNKNHHGDKDSRDMHHVQLNIEGHSNSKDTSRTVRSFFEVKIESSVDRVNLLKCNNLGDIVHLGENTSLL